MTVALTGGRETTRAAWRRANHVLGLLLLALALLAPLLANDLPLVARVAGSFRFPAFASLFGERPPGPGDSGWKQWWARLPPDGADWALMPPWAYGPGEVDPDRICAGPDLAHPLGCDDTGRDVLARLLHGCTTALWIGLLSTAGAMLVGVLLGGLAGLLGGFADFVVGRLIEIFLCFPALFLALAAGAFLGSSLLGTAAVLAAVGWPAFARIVRGELLSLRERDFVLAARGLGVGRWTLLRRHLLPQTRGPVLVVAAFAVAQAVVVESTLAFLGLEVGASSWGSVLQQGKANAHLGAWHLWFFPGLAIVLTITCCHGLADELRERRPD